MVGVDLSNCVTDVAELHVIDGSGTARMVEVSVVVGSGL